MTTPVTGEQLAAPSGRADFTTREWIAILTSVCTAFASQMTMPLWIAASIHHLHISDEIAGRVGAAEFAAVALVSLLVGMTLRRARVRSTMIAGMLILIVGNIASAAADDTVLLALGRVSCGIGKGMVVGISFGLLAGSTRPTRAFAIINGGYALFAVFFYFVTPTVVVWGGAPGVFLMLAGAATVGASLLAWYPRERLPASRKTSSSLAEVPAFGWIAAAVLALLAIGHSAIWTFVARLGEHHGLTPTQIGSALSLAALLTIAGPTLASAIEVKRGFALPMTVGVLLKAGIGAALATTASMLAYFILTPSFLLLNLFIIPYVMGMLSVADPVGRLTGSASAAQQGGNAVGALLGGILVSRVGYDGLAGLILGLFAIVIVLVLSASPVATRLARARSSA